MEGEDSQGKAGQESLDPEIMRLGPGYVDPGKAKAQELATEQPIIVTELFKEGSGDKYESGDVAWLTDSAPTDYVTLEYTCDDPEKAGWGIMGWGATVDGQWKDGPSYNAEAPDPRVRVKKMISIKALRRNFGIKAGNRVERVSLGGWNGGRLLSMTLTQGGTIPRNPVLVENAAMNQSWDCPDIEYIRDLPDNAIINLSATCDEVGHSQWEIMSWGAKVDGQWISGPKYNAAKPARYEVQDSWTASEFRRMMGMREDAKVEYLGLSVYNGGRILRLSVDEGKQPSIAYDGPSGGSSSGGGGRRKPDYVSPNLSVYRKLINAAEAGDSRKVKRFDDLSGAIPGWGQLDSDRDSQEAATLLRPGSYIVVKYHATDKNTVPALYPKPKDGIYPEGDNYRPVAAVWSNGEYAIFTYESVATRFKKCVVPSDILSLSLAASGEGTLDILWTAVVSDKDLQLATDDSLVLSEQYGQHKLDLTDYNAAYKKGDTVTVTVTLDKAVKGNIGTNIGGVWDSGSELSGTSFTRTLRPDSSDVYISVSDFNGASHVVIKEVRVDVAGQVNYDAAVIVEAPRDLAVVVTDQKGLTEAAGVTAEEIQEGATLVVTVEKQEMTEEIEKALENAPKPSGGGEPEALAVVDISMMKVSADGTEESVTGTTDKIRFTLAVPEGADTTKSFVVARIHNGKFDGWLEDLDDNPYTVTIETDRFSEYIIHSVEIVTDEEIRERGVLRTGNLNRLNRVMEKAKRGEEITIAYLGGSITNGSSAVPKEKNCYAYLTTEWWKEKFPQTKINYVNVGIGATDSYLGVHRVASDVLAEDPDLVVVEFCVNDSRSHNQESYESLLRRIFQYRTEPAVVGLFLTHFEGRVCSDWSEQHGEIAAYYDIPVVSYRDVVKPRLEDGSLEWTKIGPADDLTHPNNAGHKIISRCMTYFFGQVLADTGKTYGDYSAWQMKQDPVTPSRYENGILLDNRSGSGIQVAGQQVEKVNISEAQFPYGWQTTTGQDMVFTIGDATNIGLIYYGGMEAKYGTFDVYLDGRYVSTIDTNFYGSWGSHAEYKLLLTSGTAGSHTVRITKNQDSSGDIFTILGFTVSRSGEAPAQDYIDRFTKEELEQSQGWVSHSYALTDHLTAPVRIGTDTVLVEVTLDSDGNYFWDFGIGDSFVEKEDHWYSCSYGGTGGEETFRFLATPMYDNFMISVYRDGMTGSEVKVKDVRVTKVPALTGGNPSYTFNAGDYKKDYQAGQDIQVTVKLSKAVSGRLTAADGNGSQGAFVTGAEVTAVLKPADGMVKLETEGLGGSDDVRIREIRVEEATAAGIHTFRGTWDSGPAFELRDFASYMEPEGSEFQAGTETSVTVTFDKSVKGYIGGNVGGSWDAGEEQEGTSFTRRFVPSDEYLNVSLSDLKGNEKAELLSIEIRQESTAAEPIYTFDGEWGEAGKNSQYTSTLSEYMESGSFASGVETRVTLTFDKAVQVKIAGTENGSWKDYGNSVLSDMSSEHMFQKEDEEDSGPWSCEFAIEDYLSDFMGGQGDVICICVTLDSDSSYEGYIQADLSPVTATPSNALPGKTDASAGDQEEKDDVWENESGKNVSKSGSDKVKFEGAEIQDEDYVVEFIGSPKGDSFEICITGMEGTYVAVTSVDVSYVEKAEKAPEAKPEKLPEELSENEPGKEEKVQGEEQEAKKLWVTEKAPETKEEDTTAGSEEAEPESTADAEGGRESAAESAADAEGGRESAADSAPESGEETLTEAGYQTKKEEKEEETGSPAKEKAQKLPEKETATEVNTATEKREEETESQN